MTDEAIVSQETPAPEVVADAVTEDTSADPKPESRKFDEDYYKKALNGQQKRLDELTWRLRDTERRGQAPALPETPQAPPKAPKLEDFAFDEARYQAAQTEYLAHAARLAAREEFAKANREWEAAQVKQTFSQRETAFTAKTPDYREKLYESGVVPISDAMADAITDSEIGPEIAYYLANHREEAMQLYQLPPSLAGREIGKIEAKLAKPAAASTVVPLVPKVSNAPAPPAKIEADEPDVVEKDPAQMNPMQFAKWRRKYMKK